MRCATCSHVHVMHEPSHHTSASVLTMLCCTVLCCAVLCCAQGGFHGRTYAAMALTSSKVIYRQHFGPLMPGVHIAQYPYCLHCKVQQEKVRGVERTRETRWWGSQAWFDSLDMVSGFFWTPPPPLGKLERNWGKLGERKAGALGWGFGVGSQHSRAECKWAVGRVLAAVKQCESSLVAWARGCC
jgi:hypothetical protein